MSFMPIRNYISLFSLMLLTVIPVAAGPRPKPLKISVERGGGGSFNVAVTFRGESDGSTVLNLPNEWGGQAELFKLIQSLRVQNASIAETDKSHVKTLAHDPNAEITVSYRVVQDFIGPFRNAVRYRPVAAADHFHWIGNTVFILPAGEDSEKVAFELEWKNFPSAWTIANSFGVDQRRQKVETTLGELTAGLYVGGNYRVTRTQAAGKPVFVAIRDKWQFDDAELATMVSRVIGAQRAFWNDHSQSRYLVSLTAWDEGPNSSSFGGTGLTNAFALFATPNATIPGLRGLLSHEYSHNWIPMKMGQMPEPEQSLYWFSEGFNEFYTYRQLLKAGIISRQEYVDTYNSHIREYYTLPTRSEPNERIVKDFWNDPAVERLPYLRGFLFATNLDAAITRRSGGTQSLDDPMFEIYKSAKAGSEPTLSFEYLADVFSRYLGEDPTPLMKRQLVEGGLIEPSADALGSDVMLEAVQMDLFELGFDFEKLGKERTVAGVNPDTAAYDAGLRNGQQRVGGVSIFFGDTTKEIELRVRGDEGEKTVKFLPVAKQRLQVPQFKIR